MADRPDPQISNGPPNVLGELNDCGVQLFSYEQGVDTSTPMGDMLWQFLGIFAEFENA